MRTARGRFRVTAIGRAPSRPSRRVLLGSLVILLCAVFASQASAASGSWSSQGPNGGHVYALAIDPANPQTLYAATGGVARTMLRYAPRWLIYNRFNAWGRQRELPPPPRQSFRQWYRKQPRDKT